MISFNEARNVNVNGRTILKMSFIICWFIYYYRGLFNCSDKHLGKMFIHSLLYVPDSSQIERSEPWGLSLELKLDC